MTTGMVRPFSSFQGLVPWVESWGHLTVPNPVRATDIREELDTLDERHPELVRASVRCSTCGNEFTIRSTRSEIVVDVCSSCHPAYTGVERASARGGRVERFERRRAQSRAA
jgi:large subunit ribosomal protein L31